MKSPVDRKRQGSKQPMTRTMTQQVSSGDETFELFLNGTRCDSALPVNRITDEFRVVRFAALNMREGGKIYPAVLPRDAVNAGLMADVREKMPYLSKALVKGGSAFSREWQNIIEPEQGAIAYRDVSIPDVHRFIADPKIRLSGRVIQAELNADQIEELLTLGVTHLPVVDGKRDTLVKVHSEALSSYGDLGGSPDTAVPVGDLPSFLSAPQLRLGSAPAQKVTLTEKNVEELATLGISRVQVGNGRGRTPVYVSATPIGLRQGVPVYGAMATDGPVAWEEKAQEVVAMASVAVPATPYIAEWYAAEDTSLLDQTLSEQVLPKFEFVLYLPYRQRWHLLGYSRGELLNTVSVAPQEETTIEIFTWDRMKRSREETVGFEQEATLEVSFTDKDSLEIVKEMTKDSNWKLNINGEVSIPLVAKVGGNFDTGETLKRVDRDTRQKLSEAVRKASSRVKASRQTKVAESEEFGSEQRVTRKIKNANMCRTLNLDCFEVLASYRVVTELVLEETRLCVLTPNLLPDKIDRHFLVCHEGTLREVLLYPGTYAAGFEAAHKLLAWQRLCDVKCMSPCPCDVPHQAGVPPQGNLNAVDAARGEVAKAAVAIREVVQGIKTSSPRGLCDLKETPPTGSPDRIVERWAAARKQFHMWLYRKLGLEVISPSFWNAAGVFANGTDNSPEAVERLVREADKFSDLIGMIALPALVGIQVGQLFLVELPSMCKNPWALLSEVGFDNGGLDVAFVQARNALAAYRAATAVSPQSGDQTKKDDLEKAWEPPSEAYSAQEIAEAMVAEEALLCHIRQNESYYRQAIWQRFDPDDRLVFLSTLGSILDFVENEVVGFVGSKAAMPFPERQNGDLKEWFKKNILDNDGLRQQSEGRITLTTQGVVVEPRLGQCDACEEFITDHRTLDLKHKGAEVKAAEERAKQEALETERYTKRLARTPKPLLDDPDPNEGQNAIRIVLEKETPS